jgi:ribosomal protein L13E
VSEKGSEKDEVDDNPLDKYDTGGYVDAANKSFHGRIILESASTPILEIQSRIHEECPIVTVRYKKRMRSRKGKGYSFLELREAGITNYHLMQKRGITVDKRRKTKYPINIIILRLLYSTITRK